MRELVIVLAILGTGWTIRWWHLGTPSLWWDELVELSFAAGSDPWQVLRRVQSGVPPGSGNAGAVPADYVLLHLWTWLVGRPSIDQLEVYYRFPSYVWSCVTLIAFWAYVRAAFGAVVAMVAAALLALSIPHVLYAVEARFYSLLMLLSVLNLAAFTKLMRRPEGGWAWVAYGVVNVGFFLSGLLSVLVLPWQYAALAIRVVGERGERGWTRRLALPAITLAGLTAVLALYYASVDLGARGIRPGAALLTGGSLAQDALDFLALGEPWQLALYAWGAVVTPWYCFRRRPDMLAVMLTVIVVELVTLPILVEILQWKRYYFHPRHVLFLLPGAELLAALGICGTVAAVLEWIPGLRHRRWIPSTVAALSLLVVLGLRLPVVRGFMARPHEYFARTKTDRDLKGLVRDLRARTAFYGPQDRYLLLVDRIGPGYLGNPTLAKYLQWYSLDKRVMLRATNSMPDIIEQLQHECDGPCRGKPTDEVARALKLKTPFEVSNAKLALLDLKATSNNWPGVVRDVGVAVYPGAGARRLPAFTGSDLWLYTGIVVAEPRWTPGPPAAAADTDG
jgi:hypothetical protein